MGSIADRDRAPEKGTRRAAVCGAPPCPAGILLQADKNQIRCAGPRTGSVCTHTAGKILVDPCVSNPTPRQRANCATNGVPGGSYVQEDGERLHPTAATRNSSRKPDTPSESAWFTPRRGPKSSPRASITSSQGSPTRSRFRVPTSCCPSACSMETCARRFPASRTDASLRRQPAITISAKRKSAPSTLRSTGLRPQLSVN